MSLYLTPLSFILFLKRRVKRRVWLDLREVELPVLLRAGKEKRWMEYEGLVVRRLSQMKRAKRPKVSMNLKQHLQHSHPALPPGMSGKMKNWKWKNRKMK